MPKRYGTYQYQTGDSPLTVANQYGIQPSQLINANPGGYPFSTGQTINIPGFGGFGAPVNQPAAAPFTYSVPGQSFNYTQVGEGNKRTQETTNLPGSTTTVTPWANMQTFLPPQVQPQAPFTGQFQSPTYTGQDKSYFSGAGVPLTPLSVSRGGAHQGLYSTLMERLQQDPAAYNSLPPAMRDTVDAMYDERYNKKQGDTVTNNLGTGSSEFMNTKFMQENAANNVDFYNELRWDSREGKYRKIGDMIRSGDLDVGGGNGGWRGGRRRHEGSGSQISAQQLANEAAKRRGRMGGFGVVNFNISSG